MVKINVISKITVRLKLKNTPGVFASVARILAENNAKLGSIDVVETTSDQTPRDIIFEVPGDERVDRVLKSFEAIPGIEVVLPTDSVFKMHNGGKIQVRGKFPIKTEKHLAMAYTPGVAKISQAIADDPTKVYDLTIKQNSVAIVTDGSAVLGLGNIGPEAALPVMEGKAMLFKEFAGIDAWPICLATQNVDEIVKTVQQISPGFGGINLEDISAPRCYEIEDRLKKLLDIPVMHDDQHGTAVVLLAALKNALKIVKKDVAKIRVVVSGMGAAGVACCRMLYAFGVENLFGCNRKGVVLYEKGSKIKSSGQDLLSHIHRDEPVMTLREALKGSDVFIGVSAGNLLSPRDLEKMNKDRIVFAMANPDPEVEPHEAIKVCRIFATGRSDFPNQINNALAFPGMFRGALDVKAKEINEEMKLAAVDAIATLIPSDQLNETNIMPSIFDNRVVESIAQAVADAAHKTGVAQIKPEKKV